MRTLICIAMAIALAGCDYASVTVKDENGERSCTVFAPASSSKFRECLEKK